MDNQTFNHSELAQDPVATPHNISPAILEQVVYDLVQQAVLHVSQYDVTHRPEFTEAAHNASTLLRSYYLDGTRRPTPVEWKNYGPRG